MKHLFLTFAFIYIFARCECKRSETKPDWAKKDITDFTDVDMERLLDQWEEDEEPLEPDELPEHLRPKPAIDFSKFKDDPEALMKLSKKGQTLMSFVSIDGENSKERTESVSKLWQTSLWNNHIQAERYVVDDDRVLFVYKDGSQAWEAKDYLVEQPECKEVVIENKAYPGKHIKAEHEKEEL